MRNHMSKDFDFSIVEKKIQKFRGLYPYSSSLLHFVVSVVMGMISAYFISKSVKGFSLIIGAYLLSLQALSSQGFVAVDWEKFYKFVMGCNMQKALKLFGFSNIGFTIGFCFAVKRELNKMFS